MLRRHLNPICTFVCAVVILTATVRAYGAAIRVKEDAWPCGIVPYKTVNMTATEKAFFQKQADKWHNEANITFIDITDRQLPNDSAYLTVENANLPPQTQNAGYGTPRLVAYFSAMTDPAKVSRLEFDVLHEIGHVLGFIHEHQRPDRDDYVIVDETWSTTIAGPQERLDYVYKYAGPLWVKTAYDCGSVMHYEPKTACDSSGQCRLAFYGKPDGKDPACDAKMAPSRPGILTDIDKLAARQAYGPPGTTSCTVVVNPSMSRLHLSGSERLNASLMEPTGRVAYHPRFDWPPPSVPNVAAIVCPDCPASTVTVNATSAGRTQIKARQPDLGIEGQAELTVLDDPPPPPPPSRGTTRKTVQGVGSYDPNDKTGQDGIGIGRFVAGSVRLPIPYLVQFENKPTATAPAEIVQITDQLDATRLELTTVTLGAISFADKFVTPPSVPLSALGTYTTTVDLRPSKNLIVAIVATLNTASGTLTWTFNSLDPATGQPPAGIDGFLPPGAGGSVVFTVRPKDGLPTGTQIRNKASIVFDTNAEIVTPEWLNTIDATPPLSRVTVLSSTQANLSFPVQWSGTDQGSGIGTYDVFVSDDNAPYFSWQTNTAATQAMFTGVAGHTYRFYSIARDLVGNVEAAKSAPEATTRVVADTTPPVITPQITGTAGTNGWYRSNVSVSWAVNDPESGLASSTGCTATTLTVDTAGMTLTCSATNGAGLPSSASVTVRIDKTVPSIACTANPNTLWPPDGKPVSVAVSGTATDATSGVDPASLTYAVRDEYGQVQPSGAGVFAANGSYSVRISLLSDRNGNDTDGRKYAISVSGKDRAGNGTSCSVVVTVPHDQGQ